MVWRRELVQGSIHQNLRDLLGFGGYWGVGPYSTPIKYDDGGDTEDDDDIVIVTTMKVEK